MKEGGKAMQITSREDALMFLAMEAKELQRETDRLQTKIDAIKLEAMEELYKDAQITKE